MSRFPQEYVYIGEPHHCVDCNKRSGQVIPNVAGAPELERWLAKHVWGDHPDGTGDVCPECCDIEAGISPAQRKEADRLQAKHRRRP